MTPPGWRTGEPFTRLRDALLYGTSVSAPYWGLRKELAEVLDLAHAGAVDVHVETYTIDEAPLATRAAARRPDQRPRGHPAERLSAGRGRGR
ncbi:hypothetical protein AMK21_22475 [Streptomyces sp. CB00316]|nr:hypothetical protein AMK21_22475 [Streptomyces sp. CB00316]